MNVLFTLVLAHLIADFPLQTNRIFAMKLRSNRGIAFHVFIHLIITGLLIKEPLSHLPLFIILAVTHFSIDWLKLRFPAQRQVPGFLVDQVAHLTVLLFLAAITADAQPVLPAWLLTIALIYAFIPPVIMLLWLLAIDQGVVRTQTDRCIRWAQRRLLPLSQQAGLPLLAGVAFGLLL
jgi:hypothetical protein